MKEAEKKAQSSKEVEALKKLLEEEIANKHKVEKHANAIHRDLESLRMEVRANFVN